MKKAIGLLLIANLTACNGIEELFTPPELQADACYLMSTSMGDIELAVDMTNTPLSGKNFKQYVDKGFYDGTLFHRAVNNFVIQGGGFTSGLQQKATDAPIKNEARVGFSNVRSTLAMARTSDPNSATSQFFINVLDNPFLDYSATNDGYAVFGQVISGMEVVDQISIVPVTVVNGMKEVPVDEILIQSVTEMNCPAS